MNSPTTRNALPPLVTGLLCLALAGNAAAQGLAPLDRGWVSDDGLANTGEYGYLAGNCPSCTSAYYRNWFYFDLGCVTETITSASLVLEMPSNNGFFSVDATETYTLFDVATPLADLKAGVGGVAAYDDLGTGTVYGSVVLQENDEGKEVVVPLNAEALAVLNGALGGYVGFGGALTTLDNDPLTGERAFRYSGDWAVRLVLEPSCPVRDAVDRGWYREDALHVSTNLNYIVGNFSDGLEYRNFFVFDMDGVGGLVTGATLALEHPYQFASSDPSETYTLFHVATPLVNLLNGLDGLATFDDLAEGTVYGSYELSAADGDSLVTIPLETAALTDLNGQVAAGGQLALGGALTTLDGDPATVEFGFGSANPVHCISQIILEIEEEWTYLGGGTLGIDGQPLLTLKGPLTPSSIVDLDLVDGAPSALAIIFISFTSSPVPFLGGTLHTFPIDELVVHGTDGAGEIHGSAFFPGAASGQGLWFQVGIQDLSVSLYEASLSNAVKGTVP